MSKIARVNLNQPNSDAVRKIKDDYFAKNGISLSIESLADLCVEKGIALVRKQLHLDPK